jgi:hypothetical protein
MSAYETVLDLFDAMLDMTRAYLQARRSGDGEKFLADEQAHFEKTGRYRTAVERGEVSVN